MAVKIGPLIKVTEFHNQNKHLRWISGKWFYNDTEIKDIIRYLVRVDNGEYWLNFKDANEVEQWAECFILKYGEDGKWLDNYYMRMAKEDKSPLKPLAFPLDEKQLKIINVLLFRPEEEVFFICSGVGGSGKSTFGNIIQQLFDNDVASCSLSDLSNEFTVAEAVKHRLIYSSELASEDLDNRVIKQLASKERIFCNPKGQQGYNMQTQSSLLFNCNKPPRIDLSDTGILRRIIYYYRNKKIENPNLDLRDKKYTQDELLNIAKTAYRVDMTDWRNTFEKETHKLLMENNSVYICRDFEKYGDYVEACTRKRLRPYAEPKWIELKALIESWLPAKDRLVEIQDGLPF